MLDPQIIRTDKGLKFKKKVISKNDTRIFYESSDPRHMIVHFSDPENDFGRGAMQNRFNEFLYQKLTCIGIDHHFVRTLNMKEQLVLNADPLQFYVIVRHILTDELSDKFGVMKGLSLPTCIPEFYVGSQMITKEHITTFGWLSKDDLSDICDTLQRMNDFLIGLFLGFKMRLGHYQVQFGYDEGLDFFDHGKFIVIDSFDLGKTAIFDDETGALLTPNEIITRLIH